MELIDPQYFTILAESGSFSAAAKQIGISQPALSNRITHLEEDLGIQLVIRSKRKLILTPAGDLYLNGARQMLEIHKDVYRRIASLHSSQNRVIRIAGTPNGGANTFSRLFQAFRAEYPTISLQFIEAYNRQSMDLILNGQADFGISSSIDFSRSGITYYESNCSELALMVPYGFPTAYPSEELKKDADLPVLDLSSLKGVPFIMPDDNMSYTHALNRIFEQNNFTPNTIFRSGNVQILYNMVKNGNGISVLPRRLFSPIDRVSPFRFEPKLINHSVIVCKSGRELSPADEFIVSFLTSKPKSEWKTTVN